MSSVIKPKNSLNYNSGKLRCLRASDQRTAWTEQAQKIDLRFISEDPFQRRSLDQEKSLRTVAKYSTEKNFFFNAKKVWKELFPVFELFRVSLKNEPLWIKFESTGFLGFGKWT